MPAECSHLDQIKNVKPHTNGCEECLKMGDHWVHLRTVHDLRARGMLRFVQEQTRHQAFSRDQASHHAIDRAGRGLGMVLHR